MQVSAVQCLNQQQLIARRNDLQARLMQNNINYLSLIGSCMTADPEQLNHADTLMALENICIQFQLKAIDEQLKHIDYKA